MDPDSRNINSVNDDPALRWVNLHKERETSLRIEFLRRTNRRTLMANVDFPLPVGS
jgi:hypothetical protein